MLDDKSLLELSFPAGKNNVARETDLPEGSARELLNVDLFETGDVARRRGYASVYSGSNLHSLYSTKDQTVFAEENALKLLSPQYVATTIRTDLDLYTPLSYDSVNNQIYYSNGKQSGVVTANGAHAEWGVDTPLGQPALSTGVSGNLASGTYQVAITFVSALGEESGTRRAAVVDNAGGGGIQLSNIPSGNAASINIYLSSANGDVLYLHSTVPMGTVSYELTNKATTGRALETQFMERMPAGQVVRYFRGRMWVANGSLLLFSPALRFGVYDPRFLYFNFPEDITIVEPVEDGVYVVADRTYFLSGKDPEKMKQEIVHRDRGILHTGMSIPPDALDMENDMISSVFSEKTFDYVAFWYGETGAVLGFPGGRIKAIMEDRLNIPEYEKGATLLREENGLRQLVTTLTNKGSGNSFGATDTAVAEVRRNGVTI